MWQIGSNSLFWPKKVYSKAKIENFLSFMLIDLLNVSEDTTMCTQIFICFDSDDMEKLPIN